MKALHYKAVGADAAACGENGEGWEWAVEHEDVSCLGCLVELPPEEFTLCTGVKPAGPTALDVVAEMMWQAFQRPMVVIRKPDKCVCPILVGGGIDHAPGCSRQ